jgi:peptide/nickel transport system substrate-binding protein
MKRNLVNLLAALVVLTMLVSVLAACGPTPAPTAVVQPTAAAAQPTAAPAQPTAAPAQPTTAPQPTAAPAAERKVATFIWTQEFDTLNPLYTNMWFSATTFQLWNCYAWNFDDKAEPVPVLVNEMPSAANGGISPDGKVITLKLRDDLVWSDGTPLTSEDFVFTYEMAIDPKNAVASTYPYDQMESVEAPDATTVVMTFKEPFAPWLGTLWKGILPAHIVRPMYEAAGTLDTVEWNKKPTVGCGPYTFQEWESGSFARFVANENYWLGKPKIDEIFFRFVPDDASQVAALQTGDGDLGTFIAYSDMPALEDAGIKIIPAFSGYNEGIYFYLHETKGKPALKDIAVRKAIALATDRFSLCKDLLLGMTVPASTDWDNTPWNDPSLQPWPYDPEQAKKILDDAGWVDSNGDGVRDKNGEDLSFTYGTTTREIRKDTQAVFQQQLAAVGIKVDLLNYDSDIFFGTYAEGGPAAVGDLDLIEFSTTFNFPDPDSADWLCSEIPSDENPAGVATSQICDKELDDLFTLQRTQVDLAAREETFHKITKHIFDNVYWLGLWQDPDTWAVGKRLQNVKISGATPFYSIMDWDLTP